MLDELALNPIAFDLGPIQVHWYGIFIASAVMLAVVLSAHEAQRQHVDPENIYDLIIYALPIAIISARVYYVLFQWRYYQNHLDQIIAIWDGGIAIYGGLIGAAIVVYCFCKHRGISVWTMLDIVAPTVIMGQAIGRWGNFMNQEAFGQITSFTFLKDLHLPMWLINQMFIQGAYRQPTFLYESIWDALGFILLMTLRHVPKFFKHGEIVLCYVAWYAFGRFFTEGMRTDSLMLGDIRFSQLLSVIFFIGAIMLIIVRRYQNSSLNWYLD